MYIYIHIYVYVYICIYIYVYIMCIRNMLLSNERIRKPHGNLAP